MLSGMGVSEDGVSQISPDKRQLKSLAAGKNVTSGTRFIAGSSFHLDTITEKLYRKSPNQFGNCDCDGSSREEQLSC